MASDIVRLSLLPSDLHVNISQHRPVGLWYAVYAVKRVEPGMARRPGV